MQVAVEATFDVRRACVVVVGRLFGRLNVAGQMYRRFGPPVCRRRAYPSDFCSLRAKSFRVCVVRDRRFGVGKSCRVCVSLG